MKFLIATDSFKGSLTSPEAAACVKEGIIRVFPGAEFVCLPVADGGEGTVNTVLSATRGRLITAKVKSPLGHDIDAGFAILDTGEAVIEMAQASGLLLDDPSERNILLASTYGTGQLIIKALDMGCRRIFIGIGGSATNDGGAGMASAIGAKLLDKDGRELPPGGVALKDLETIDISCVDPRIKDAEILVMCDVDNPLLGANGASAIYGPQKGATMDDVRTLEDSLTHYADVVEDTFAMNARALPGAGAAGGLGMGLLCFTGAKLVKGIDAILNLTDFDEELKTADLVITGEGKLDHQSSRGKVIFGVLERCEAANVPVIALCGRVTDEGRHAFGKRFRAIVASAAESVPLELAMKNAKSMLTAAAERIIRQLYDVFPVED